MPTLPFVEAAFASAPFATPTYVNLADYVGIRAIEAERGRRSRSGGRMEPGTLRMSIDDIDRVLDPTNTGSPFYAGLLPRRKVRVSATSGSTRRLFTGYIEDYPQEYSIGRLTQLEIVAADAFAIFAESRLPDSVWALEVAADGATQWWPLSDKDSTSAGNTISDYAGTYINSPQWGSGILAFDQGSAVQFAGDDYVRLPETAGLTSLPFTIDFWIHPEQSQTAGLVSLVQQAGALGIVMDTAGTASGLAGSVYVQFASSGGDRWKRSSVPVNDGRRHHVAVVYGTSDATRKIYVDGVDVTTNISGSASGTVESRELYVGYYPWPHLGQVGFKGRIGHVVFTPSALSAGRIAARNEAGTTPWVGDTSGARVGKLLDLIGWPAADRTIDTGNSTLGPTGLGGFLLDHLRRVDRTERGACFMTGGGKVRFRERHATLKPPGNVSVATFKDDNPADAAGTLHYEELRPAKPIEALVNEARMTRTGGVEQVVIDATSQTDHGPRALSETDLAHERDPDTLALAQWTVEHGRVPELRLDRLVVSSLDETYMLPQMLDREIGDRVTAVKRFASGPDLNQDAHIVGVRHVADGDGNFRTEWPLDPAETQSYWILGTSQLGDPGTRLGY